MVAVAAEMAEDVGVVATGFFQGVGENAHPLIIEESGRQCTASPSFRWSPPCD
jgi:hypothetical protein